MNKWIIYASDSAVQHMLIFSHFRGKMVECWRHFNVTAQFLLSWLWMINTILCLPNFYDYVFNINSLLWMLYISGHNNCCYSSICSGMVASLLSSNAFLDLVDTISKHQKCYLRLYGLKAYTITSSNLCKTMQTAWDVILVCTNTL